MATLIDSIIAKCNKGTMKDTMEALRGLTTTERTMLKVEYQKSPDLRFGDNLLVATSLLCEYQEY